MNSERKFPFDDTRYSASGKRLNRRPQNKNQYGRGPLFTSGQSSHNLYSYAVPARRQPVGKWVAVFMVLVGINAFLMWLLFSGGDETTEAGITIDETITSDEDARSIDELLDSNFILGSLDDITETATTILPQETVNDTPLSELPPSIENPVIALTFDDGPSPYTVELLDMLQSKNVKATFFLLGEQIDKFGGEIVKRIASEGHELGNHSYDHPILTRENFTQEQVVNQLKMTSEKIYQAAGANPTVFRPPTGSFNETVLAVAKSMNMYTVNWTWQSCPKDWEEDKKNPVHISNYVVENGGNGHIVLLHDIHEATVQSIPDMIDGLRTKGYRFATVSELMAFNNSGYDLGIEYSIATT